MPGAKQRRHRFCENNFQILLKQYCFQIYLKNIIPKFERTIKYCFKICGNNILVHKFVEMIIIFKFV